jgi:hypothetical protein
MGAKMKTFKNDILLKSENEILIDGLYDIHRYLNSDKFSNDIMVNKNDILLRIQEILNDADSVN